MATCLLKVELDIEHTKKLLKTAIRNYTEWLSEQGYLNKEHQPLSVDNIIEEFESISSWESENE